MCAGLHEHKLNQMQKVHPMTVTASRTRSAAPWVEGYQRNNLGPSKAPKATGSAMPTPYQTNRNGAASSGQ